MLSACSIQSITPRMSKKHIYTYLNWPVKGTIRLCAGKSVYLRSELILQLRCTHLHCACLTIVLWIANIPISWILMHADMIKEIFMTYNSQTVLLGVLKLSLRDF